MIRFNEIDKIMELKKNIRKNHPFLQEFFQRTCLILFEYVTENCLFGSNA